MRARIAVIVIYHIFIAEIIAEKIGMQQCFLWHVSLPCAFFRTRNSRFFVRTSFYIAFISNFFDYCTFRYSTILQKLSIFPLVFTIEIFFTIVILYKVRFLKNIFSQLFHPFFFKIIYKFNLKI